MPHVIVKMISGKSEKLKTEMAEKIVKDVMAVLEYGEEAVSLAIEEVPMDRWTESVYKPDIQAHWDALYKKPGYEPL
jgi:4-oxalocrotonate tautomerase